MWTPTTRRQHSREGLRYETDLTDAEWAPLAQQPQKFLLSSEEPRAGLDTDG